METQFLQHFNPDMTVADVFEEAHRLGLEIAGSGVVAVCFLPREANGRALKLVCAEEAHHTAVKLFVAHPEVAAFPDIYGTLDLNNGCLLYETEALEPDDDGDEYDSSDLNTLEQLLEVLHGGPRLILREDPARYPDREVFIESHRLAMGEDLAEPLDLILQTSWDESLYIDLHRNNHMLRTNGEVVLTDPYHRWSSVNQDSKYDMAEVAEEYGHYLD